MAKHGVEEPVELRGGEAASVKGSPAAPLVASLRAFPRMALVVGALPLLVPRGLTRLAGGVEEPVELRGGEAASVKGSPAAPLVASLRASRLMA